MSATPSARDEYLARLKARLRSGKDEPDLAPTRIAAPTLTLSDAPTAQKNGEPALVAAFHDRVVARHELDEVARMLSRSSLDVLVVLAKRLAEVEKRT